LNPQAQKVISALKAARAALDWSQDDLAKRSGTALVTIARMEAARVSPRLSTVAKLKQTLEAAGVRIIDESPHGGFTVVVEGRALAPDLADSEQRTRIGRSAAAKKRKCPDNQPLVLSREPVRSDRKTRTPTRKSRNKIG
jgi:transcriptional regulator with XRE-family HTH domain